MKKFLIIIGIILAILVGGGVVAYNKMNKVNMVKLEATDEELNVSPEVAEESKERKITNILLMGVDNIENASDSMMILSICGDDNTVKLTSVMRDTYVYFGEGMANKLNYAYTYGGVQLTISKFNELFNLDITKYAKVSINDFMKIVDTLGGYEVNLTEEQRLEINKKLGYDSIPKSGKVILNGEQTSAYARIRVIDSDFQRTQRQRQIMFDIFKKLKNMPVTSYPDTIGQLSSYVETNLSTMECLDLAKSVFKAAGGNAEEFRIPIDGTTSDSVQGVYHLNWNEEVNKKALHEFIYGN